MKTVNVLIDCEKVYEWISVVAELGIGEFACFQCGFRGS
jgi:hypothetical protein